jgi:hypothetical protein
VKRLRLLLAPLALLAGAALADPGYYVVTAYADPGVRTADLRYWSVKFKQGPAVLWPEAGFGWNVNGRWYTEVLASGIGSSRMSMRPSSLNWQNDVLLTQGELPVDIAVHTLLFRPLEPAEGHSLEFGPALQTDVGRTQVNFNVFLVRGFAQLAAQPTELRYQWQLRHRWMRGLHVGAQGFGELGPWRHWLPAEAQSHRAGPALFGTWPLGDAKLGWQAAYLVGKTYAQRSGMFTLRAKLDF